MSVAADKWAIFTGLIGRVTIAHVVSDYVSARESVHRAERERVRQLRMVCEGLIAGASNVDNPSAELVASVEILDGMLDAVGGLMPEVVEAAASTLAAHWVEDSHRKANAF